jgi:hypothetical protein
MSEFGRVAFGNSRFVRWTVTPCVLFMAVVALVPLDEWTVQRAVVTVSIELLCIGMLVGYWLPARIGRWGFRVVAGTIFLAYSGYLVDELLFTETPLRVTGRRSDSSPLNALLGYALIGVPALWYTLLGRFTLRAPRPESELDEPDDDDSGRADGRLR